MRSINPLVVYFLQNIGWKILLSLDFQILENCSLLIDGHRFIKVGTKIPAKLSGHCCMHHFSASFEKKSRI